MRASTLLAHEGGACCQACDYKFGQCALCTGVGKGSDQPLQALVAALNAKCLVEASGGCWEVLSFEF